MVVFVRSCQVAHGTIDCFWALQVRSASKHLVSKVLHGKLSFPYVDGERYRWARYISFPPRATRFAGPFPRKKKRWQARRSPPDRGGGEGGRGRDEKGNRNSHCEKREGYQYVSKNRDRRSKQSFMFSLHPLGTKTAREKMIL